MDIEQIYLAHRESIEDAIRSLCARQRLPASDADDFASDARLHLLKNDGAVVRAFAGRSSLKTYLTVVLGRLFQDWRNARWGKWRPTVTAVRLGPLAVRLETLTARDRHTFDEACAIIRTAEPAVSVRELESLWEQLPVRSRRAHTSVDTVEHVLAADSRTDSLLVRAWAEATSAQVAALLRDAVRSLSPEDRLLLAMRFEDGLSVQEVARRQGVEVRPLYRQLNKILEQLREYLQAHGVTGAEALEAMSHVGFESAPSTIRDGRPARTEVGT